MRARPQARSQGQGAREKQCDEGIACSGGVACHRKSVLSIALKGGWQFRELLRRRGVTYWPREMIPVVRFATTVPGRDKRET
jgi:hypothetical protein